METTFSSSTAAAANKGPFMQNICYIIPYSYIIDAHENKKKGHVLSLSILYFYIPHPYSLIVSYKLPAGALYMFISWTTATISIR
jgi:hypothetical protein